MRGGGDGRGRADGGDQRTFAGLVERGALLDEAVHLQLILPGDRDDKMALISM